MTGTRQHSWPARALVILVRLYQLTLSPLLGVTCRYQPSCSAYAIDALKQHGVWRGIWLTTKRFGRCHPFGGHGYDPVPPAASGGSST